jgi:hypothetical protein
VDTKPDKTFSFDVFTRKVPIYDNGGAIIGYNKVRKCVVSVSGKRVSSDGMVKEITLSKSWTKLPSAFRTQALPVLKWLNQKFRDHAIAVDDNADWVDPEE